LTGKHKHILKQYIHPIVQACTGEKKTFKKQKGLKREVIMNLKILKPGIHPKSYP
jgi:hypothetical protein